MRTTDFDYLLPPERIAQTPVEPRDSSRLMVLSRDDGTAEHRCFRDLGDYLQEGDLLVCNDSRVIPARLKGSKVGGGARVELLLLRRLEAGVWETLVKPGRRLKAGTAIELGSGPFVQARVLERTESGNAIVGFDDEDAIESLGVVPLPPYVHHQLDDSERYQTVYSRVKGSVAAPTAGLHFTPELMDRLQEKGVRVAFVTLHLALDSFRPVQVDDPRDHVIHREYGLLSSETASEVNRAKAEGRRVICVGTSSMRVLEYVSQAGGGVIGPFDGWIDLFIFPGHRFQVADAMVTNFHLPRSTLLMLVSAFAGRERVLAAYQEAMGSGYRFYSFGDAMLIL